MLPNDNSGWQWITQLLIKRASFFINNYIINVQRYIVSKYFMIFTQSGNPTEIAA